MQTSTKWALGAAGVLAALYLFWPKSSSALPSNRPSWLPANIPPQKAYSDYIEVPSLQAVVAWNLDKNVAQAFPAGSIITVSQQENKDMLAAGVTGAIFYANDGTGKTARFYSAVNA